MKIVIEIPEAYEYAFKGGDNLSDLLARVSGDIMKLGFHECGPYEKGVVEMLREALEHCEPLPECKTGKWIRLNDTSKPMYGWYFCSECGSYLGDADGANYCSWCGTKMEVDE